MKIASFNANRVGSDAKFEKELKRKYEIKNSVSVDRNEIKYKKILESAGRRSYFTELFEGVPLEEQFIEVEGFDNPKESKIFNNGRVIAKRLVDNGIANMDNYYDFCDGYSARKSKGR